MNRVLILGAGSDVGIACAEEFARNKFDIQLAGRKSDRFEAQCNDLHIKYKVNATAHEFDADVYESHKAFVDGLGEQPDVVICMIGFLGKQELAQSNFEECHRILSTNYIGAVSVLNQFADRMEEQKSGIIIGVSSVAGERGRMSNYLYGSAKAGFTAYLSGLRNRLFHSKVHVITVKPGFMDTKMTEGLALPGPLTAKPHQAAKSIFKAFEKKNNTVYILGRWRWVMLVIKSIPEGIFKRLKL